MSIQVTLPSQQVSLNSINLINVIDEFKAYRIMGLVAGLPKPLILWSGEQQYTEAANWTNESAQNRASDLLASGQYTFL